MLSLSIAARQLDPDRREAKLRTLRFSGTSQDKHAARIHLVQHRRTIFRSSPAAERSRLGVEYPWSYDRLSLVISASHTVCSVLKPPGLPCRRESPDIEKTKTLQAEITKLEERILEARRGVALAKQLRQQARGRTGQSGETRVAARGWRGMRGVDGSHCALGC